MKYTTPFFLIVFFSSIIGCNKNLSRPLPNYESVKNNSKEIEIDRGKISVYPARMTEISSREKLLNLDGLLEASFIYEAISGTRQASFSNISRNSFGLDLSAREYLTQSSEEQTSESAQINANSSFAQSIEGSNTSNTNTNQQEDSGSSSSSNNSTSQTNGFVDESENIYQYSALTSPENSVDKEVAYRELITAVANAQLGGRGLLRRMNLSPLSSETHKMYMLPVDVNFTPGRYTSKNYRGHASLELSLPHYIDNSSINIIAVAPMGYSQIVSEFSSALRELSASAFAGIGTSGILMEGKLEALIQQLSELDAIVSQPEFAVNISDPNRVQFDYFGSQDLSGASKLKAQSFQVELLILIGGKDYSIKKREITGVELIQKFENASFNNAVAGMMDQEHSPTYKYKWYFSPTEELKERNLSKKKMWDSNFYGEDYSKPKEILMTQQLDDFSIIDLNSVSIFHQNEIKNNKTEEENGNDSINNHKGLLVFEGTGLDVHRKIKNIYKAPPDERDANDLQKQFEDKLDSFEIVTSNEGSINPGKDLSSFVVTISTSSGDVITHNHINNNSWISDKHIGFDFESREQLQPGQKLNVVLQVRELIKDDLENNSEPSPLETIVLYKTLTISGKKVIPIAKGVSDLTTKAIPLERGVVAIEISFNQKGVTAGTFEVNGTPIEDFILDKTTDLTNASGEAYQRVNKTLKIKLSNDEQELQETSKNKYYLVIKDNSSDEPKVLISKLIEE